MNIKIPEINKLSELKNYLLLLETLENYKLQNSFSNSMTDNKQQNILNNQQLIK